MSQFIFFTTLIFSPDVAGALPCRSAPLDR